MDNTDIVTNEVRDSEYPLSGLNKLFRDFQQIKASAIDKSDYQAVNMLVDFERAYENVKLTGRQQGADRFIYYEGITQKEAGERMGITQQAVGQLLQAVLKKISAYLRGEYNG